jgi:tetratricopeptide (TPR) repeat protein
MRKVESKMKKILAILCFAALVAGNLFAHTSGFVKKTCPVCAREFEAEMDMSGTQFGMRLDLKPLGAIAAPWRLAVCPECHFVLYTDQLSGEERDNLRKYLASAEYVDLVQEKHSSYFLLARILKEMKEDHFAVAYAYLQASWQVEKEPARQLEYLNACLGELKRCVEKKGEDKDVLRTAQLLIGEILRRTSKFDRAAEHFEQISALSEFKEQPYRTICDYQLKLIQKRDAAPKEIPPIEMTEPDIRQTPAFKMLETSPPLSSFTDLFSVSDLHAKEGSTYGVYFFGEEEWSGNFTPTANLPCQAMAELIFPVDTNDVISVGLTATQVLEALTEVCNAPFVQRLVNAEKPGKVRLRAAGNRLHWDTEEVENYRSILKAAGIEPAPVRKWMKVILDLPKGGMISMYHPFGEDLYIVDCWLSGNPSWRDQYQELTGKTLSENPFPDDKYCPVVDRKGRLRLIEKRKETGKATDGD